MLERLKAALPAASAVRGWMGGALPQVARARFTLMALAVASAAGCALYRDLPLRSVEALSSGADLAARNALDADQFAAHYRALFDNIEADVLGPALQGTIYKTFGHETMRGLFPDKHVEIQSAIENELAGKHAAKAQPNAASS